MDNLSEDFVALPSATFSQHSSMSALFEFAAFEKSLLPFYQPFPFYLWMCVGVDAPVGWSAVTLVFRRKDVVLTGGYFSEGTFITAAASTS